MIVCAVDPAPECAQPGHISDRGALIYHGTNPADVNLTLSSRECGLPEIPVADVIIRRRHRLRAGKVGSRLVNAPRQHVRFMLFFCLHDVAVTLRPHIRYIFHRDSRSCCSGQDHVSVHIERSQQAITLSRDPVRPGCPPQYT